MAHSLIQFAILFGSYLAFRLALSAIPVLWRWVVRLRAKRRVWAGKWSLSLLVRLDENDARLYPSVQLLGTRLPNRSKLRLELIDWLGEKRYSAIQDVPPWALGKELALRPFESPARPHITDALRWRWDLTLSAGRHRLGHWSESLAPAGGITEEAEIAIGAH
jgi:hypothetical protein